MLITPQTLQCRTNRNQCGPDYFWGTCYVAYTVYSI
uniref:Uncharacterized protein n=1 Tax=Anguilla anguilla TaxID=7936 RepID=A0A0E9SZ20_ANGAN